jgi:hypothetical protein
VAPFSRGPLSSPTPSGRKPGAAAKAHRPIRAHQRHRRLASVLRTIQQRHLDAGGLPDPSLIRSNRRSCADRVIKYDH